MSRSSAARWPGTGGGGGRGLADEPRQERAEVARRRPAGVGHGLEGVAGHVGGRGVGRVLDHGGPAALGDGAEPAGPVVERPGQDHADDARAVRDGGRAEQGVHGRARAVLAQAVGQADGAGRDQQVAVGRGHVDAAGLDGLAVARQTGRERPALVQDLAQRAGRLCRRVLDDEDGGLEVGREPAHERAQRLEAAQRGAHHDDVAPVRTFGVDGHYGVRRSARSSRGAPRRPGAVSLWGP